MPASRSRPSASPAAGARARVRAELTQEITDCARAHLARDGAAALSLRAVARDLGMSSSAVYRYFPSRDALLTQLIVDAYNSLGDAVEGADRRLTQRHPENYSLRTHAAFRGVRSWALAHPHEWALIYGSPVPGYAAPQDTIGPATRVPMLLLTLLFAAAQAGQLDDQSVALVPGDPALAPPTWIGDAQAVSAVPHGTDLLATAVAIRAAVYGVISFELNGQHHQVISDDDAFFEGALASFLFLLGLHAATS